MIHSLVNVHPFSNLVFLLRNVQNYLRAAQIREGGCIYIRCIKKTCNLHSTTSSNLHMH